MAGAQGRPRSVERERFFADIIVGATEGGTNYWAYSRNYSWSESEPALTTVQFCEMEEVDESDEGAVWHTCNMETIAKAFTLIRSHAVPLPDRTRKRYDEAYRTMDAGDLDAGDADTIVQIGMFGKEVYG